MLGRTGSPIPRTPHGVRSTSFENRSKDCQSTFNWSNDYSCQESEEEEAQMSSSEYDNAVSNLNFEAAGMKTLLTVKNLLTVTIC